MPITPRNITKHELIGLEIEVVEAKNKLLIGIKGKIIDERKNILIIENSEGKIKKLIKEQIKFKTKIGGKTIIVDGKAIVGRPEERIKK